MSFCDIAMISAVLRRKANAVCVVRMRSLIQALSNDRTSGGVPWKSSGGKNDGGAQCVVGPSGQRSANKSRNRVSKRITSAGSLLAPRVLYDRNEEQKAQHQRSIEILWLGWLDR